MKTNRTFFPTFLCFSLSLAALIYFKDSPQPWRFYFSLAGYSFFTALFAMQLIALIAKRKMKVN